MFEFDSSVVTLQSPVILFQIFPVSIVLLVVENLSKHP
jgi:hypothetical protein